MVVISDFNSRKQHDASILIPKINAKYEVNSCLLGDNVKVHRQKKLHQDFRGIYEKYPFFNLLSKSEYLS